MIKFIFSDFLKAWYEKAFPSVAKREQIGKLRMSLFEFKEADTLKDKARKLAHVIVDSTGLTERFDISKDDIDEELKNLTEKAALFVIKYLDNDEKNLYKITMDEFAEIVLRSSKDENFRI